MTSFTNSEPGLSVRTKLNNALQGFKSVKDFGAIGNGIADDSAAIQNAINYSASPYSTQNRGIVFFPLGTYIVNTTINLPTSIRAFSLIGVPGSRITGDINGPLINRPEESPYGGMYGIEYLDFSNTHDTGTDVLLHSCVGVAVRNCRFSGHIGIETFNSQAATIDTCVFLRDGGTTYEGSIGIVAGNATSVFNSDVTGYGDGIRHQNLGLNVIGGRYEVNGRGIVLGETKTGVHQSNGVLISGLSMESNKTGIEITAGGAVTITGCAITGNDGLSVRGIYINNGEEIEISGSTVGTDVGFSQGCVVLGNPQRVVFSSFLAKPGAGVGPAWVLPTGGQLASCDFIGCTPVVEGGCTFTDLVTYGSQLPFGTIRRMTDATTTTPGQVMTVGGGLLNATVIKIQGTNRWMALGTGT